MHTSTRRPSAEFIRVDQAVRAVKKIKSGDGCPFTTRYEFLAHLVTTSTITTRSTTTTSTTTDEWWYQLEHANNSKDRLDGNIHNWCVVCIFGMHRWKLCANMVTWDYKKTVNFYYGSMNHVASTMIGFVLSHIRISLATHLTPTPHTTHTRTHSHTHA
jgi:hypothetical protein